jgi:hypothetical protein
MTDSIRRRRLLFHETWSNVNRFGARMELRTGLLQASQCSPQRCTWSITDFALILTSWQTPRHLRQA